MWACRENRTLTASILRKNKELKDLFINSLTAEELDALNYDWSFWARDEQLPPDEWINGNKYIWNLRCGRGWGKTRTAGQTFIEAVKAGYKRLSLCGATAEEVRDIMINGESGIAQYCPPELGMDYKPSQKKIFFKNGAVVSIFYGSEPEKSRGAQSDFIWCDEIHKWQYPEETFDNLILGLRLGNNPLCIVTSTPKPTAFAKKFEKMTDEKGNPCVTTTVGSTYSNVDNLSKKFFSTIISKYKGTRLALQELFAQILDGNPNALFKKEWIEYNRVDELPLHVNRYRVITSVDPATSHNPDTSNHTGIITILEGAAPEKLIMNGEVKCRRENHYYVLRDSSVIGTPNTWGSMAVSNADLFNAVNIVIEDNQGGDLTELALINAGCKTAISRVRAVKDKQTRAATASMLCEQGRIHFYRDPKTYNVLHGIDNLDVLEQELTDWVPGSDSPDRMDAFVHGINWLQPNMKDTGTEVIASNIIASAFATSGY